MRKQLISLRRY